MLLRLTLLGAGILASLGYGAPRPGAKAPKPPKALQVTPGNYKMLWNGGPWSVTLTDKGVYTAGGVWLGGWSWSEKTREFSVTETCNNGSSYLIWYVKLDDKLKGEGVLGANSQLTLELEPLP